MIATHTNLAAGFKKALLFFTGTGEDIVTVCAYEDSDDSPRDEIERFFAAVDSRDTVVVFTDLLGGSVNQIMAEKLKTKNFHLITEANLSVIIAVATLGEEEINAESIRENIELCKSQMKYMNDLLIEQSNAPKTNTSDDFF
jgi:mannose/fructose-specific phosphotransferase system component IIA